MTNLTDEIRLVDDPTLPLPGASGSHLPFVCEICGKDFPSSAALGGHKSAGHRPPKAAYEPQKFPCPECGDLFIGQQGLGRHRQAVHGIAGKRTLTHPPKKAPTPKKPVAPQPTSVIPTFEHTDIGDWLDDIFTATVTLLFPDGTVPTRDLDALIGWRDDTRRMLTEVLR